MIFQGAVCFKQNVFVKTIAGNGNDRVQTVAYATELLLCAVVKLILKYLAFKIMGIAGGFTGCLVSAAKFSCDFTSLQPARVALADIQSVG
ncbi:hypothetical protein [Aliamphritea spongicola]|nr:hypothetical protein [Aliamphritea spongicola]